MKNTRIYHMLFRDVYGALVDKAERKHKTRTEVDALTTWLTGYTSDQLRMLEKTDKTYAEFFEESPRLQPNRRLITGKICGVQIEQISEPLMQNIRYLDKLIDELAKGKTIERILERYDSVV